MRSELHRVGGKHLVVFVDGLLNICRLLRCGTSLCQLSQCAPKASAGNLGLAVNRRMAREFGGDASRIRAASERRVARALGLSPRRLSPLERRAFSSLALVLDLIPDLSRWPRAERDALAAIVRAKASRSERLYLRLMQKHDRLRRALIRLGSA